MQSSMQSNTQSSIKNFNFEASFEQGSFVPNKPKKKFDDGTNYVEKPKKTKKSKFNKNKRQEIEM